jgi:hypothetical protein
MSACARYHLLRSCCFWVWFLGWLLMAPQCSADSVRAESRKLAGTHDTTDRTESDLAPVLFTPLLCSGSDSRGNAEQYNKRWSLVRAHASTCRGPGGRVTLTRRAVEGPRCWCCAVSGTDANVCGPEEPAGRRYERHLITSRCCFERDTDFRRTYCSPATGWHRHVCVEQHEWEKARSCNTCTVGSQHVSQIVSED